MYSCSNTTVAPEPPPETEVRDPSNDSITLLVPSAKVIDSISSISPLKELVKVTDSVPKLPLIAVISVEFVKVTVLSV